GKQTYAGRRADQPCASHKSQKKQTAQNTSLHAAQTNPARRASHRKQAYTQH
ncbi:hypothetical protein A2U01_0116961, partial [Trifolium medium]|nr:hypothetical protein [Trifolium medium]